MRKAFFILVVVTLLQSSSFAARVEITGGGGGGSVGDNITVNTTAATNANFLDNTYMDIALDAAATPDDVTWKFNFNATSGDIALLTNEVALALNGLVSEGVTADTIEGRFAFPDWATSDKVITFQDATHTVVGRDTTDTLTNKTMTAANNVIDADTAVALAADPADCATSTYFAVGVTAAGAATCEAIADADVPNTITVDLATTVTTNANLTGEVTSVGNAATIADSVTVTGWELGAATAATSLTSPAFISNNADPADAGIVRLGNAENIAWEASPAGTDETLTVSSAKNFQISGPIEIDASDPADAEAIRLDNAEGIAWEASPAGTDVTLKVDASEILQVSGALNTGGAITGSNLSGTNTGDNTVATTGDSATAFFSAGTLEVAIGGTGTTTSTGTGAVVLGTSPTFTTSIAIPQGTAPTVDAAGEIAVDTTDDQLKYYGGAVRILPYERTICFVIENLAAADDNYAFWMANDAITVTGVGCNCRGTCTTAATFTLEDRGGNAMTITGTNPTCATNGAATFAAVTAVNTLTAGEMVAFDVTNAVSPETDEYSLCVTYVIDSQ